MKRDQESWSNRLFSKRITVAVIAWGMAVPLFAMFLKPDLFAAAMTGGVATIGGAMAGYMGTGHADFRTAVRATIPGAGHRAADPYNLEDDDVRAG